MNEKFFIFKEEVESNYEDGYVEDSNVSLIPLSSIGTQDAIKILRTLFKQIDEKSLKEIEKETKKDISFLYSPFDVWKKEIEGIVKALDTSFSDEFEVYEAYQSSFMQARKFDDNYYTFKALVETLTGKREHDMEDILRGKTDLFIKIDIEKLAKKFPKMKKSIASIKEKIANEKEKQEVRKQNKKIKDAEKKLEEAKKILAQHSNNS